MMCLRHAKLLRFYQRAERTYLTTLDALGAARATTSRPEYERLARYVEQARAKLDQARNELDRHIAEHDCYASVRAARA